MNSLTLPRWFGRRGKKKESDDEPKPPEIVWLKEDSAPLAKEEDPNQTVVQVHRAEQDPQQPPSLDEVAEAKRRLRKAVSSGDILKDEVDFDGFYQNLAFNARVQGRPLPEPVTVTTEDPGSVYEQFGDGLTVKPLDEKDFRGFKSSSDSSGVETWVTANGGAGHCFTGLTTSTDEQSWATPPAELSKYPSLDYNEADYIEGKTTKNYEAYEHHSRKLLVKSPAQNIKVPLYSILKYYPSRFSF